MDSSLDNVKFLHPVGASTFKYGVTNFVLAHSACNNSKRDFLSAPSHLEQWHKRNQQHGKSLGQEFDARSILHNQAATEKIAFWAYSQAETTGSNLWLNKVDVMPIDQSWRQMMGKGT